MIYYTSDLHFGHKNIIKYENRPFKSILEMEYILIKNWNNKVKSKEDHIYILGDFAFKGSNLSIDQINNIVDSLKGKKHLIIGNHDQFINSLHFKERLWEEIVPYKEIIDQSDKVIIDNKENIIENKNIILFHYPIENWNRTNIWLNTFTSDIYIQIQQN